MSYYIFIIALFLLFTFKGKQSVFDIYFSSLTVFRTGFSSSLSDVQFIPILMFIMATRDKRNDSQNKGYFHIYSRSSIYSQHTKEKRRSDSILFVSMCFDVKFVQVYLWCVFIPYLCPSTLHEIYKITNLISYIYSVMCMYIFFFPIFNRSRGKQ